MTTEDQIYLASAQKQLRQTPPKYLDLLAELGGEKLTSEKAAMCEELYLLDLVIRVPDETGNGDTRYLSKGRIDTNGYALCYWCRALQKEIDELKELLFNKTAFAQSA